MVAKLDGTLSAPAAGDAEDVALDYVRANLPALGLDEDDLDTLRPPSTTTSGSVTTVRWRQAVDGIPAADSELRVNVTRDGSVLSVLGAPAHDLDPATTPALTAGEAVRAVQDDVGVYRSLPRERGPAGATRATTYADGTTAALALFDGRLAWRVSYRAASDAVYDVLVDAASGKLLRRANLVKSDAPAKVWKNYPGATDGGNAETVDLAPWLTSSTELLGPNVHAYSDINDDDIAQASEEVVPGSYDLVTDPFTGSGCLVSKPCTWSGSGTTWQTNRQQNAVQAFYLANRFHDHLAAAPIGFTDRSFEGPDRLLLQTDDGANTGPDNNHINNANMYTPPDGSSPVMQMYLWRGSSYRMMNGGDDASILYHEYTHGLSNRLVRDAGGAGALNTAQAGAMGEGWSDWYAKDYLVSEFPGLDTLAAGDVHMGIYTDAATNSIRSQGLDCPVGASATACPGRGLAGSGGYTYGDFGRISGGPEVHYDGEIWAETLWDLRTAIGSSDAVRLVTQGMRLSPPEPTFLDMRNAILLADQAAGGTRRDAIWTVFAARGMGYYATSTGSGDTSPLEDFSAPPAAGEPRGTIAGRVTDVATGLPLAGATAALGSVTAAADTDGRYALTASARAQLREPGDRQARLRPPRHRRHRERERDDDAGRRAAPQLGRAGRWRERVRQRRVRRPGLRIARGDRPERGDHVVDSDLGERQGDGRNAAVGGRRGPLRDRPGRGLRRRFGRVGEGRADRDLDDRKLRTVDRGRDEDVRRRGSPPHERGPAGARGSGGPLCPGDDPEHVDGVVDVHGHERVRGLQRGSDTHADADRDTDGHGDPDGDAHRDGHADRDPHAHPDSRAHRGADRDGDGDRRADGDGDGDRAARDPDPRADAGRHRDAGTRHPPGVPAQRVRQALREGQGPLPAGLCRDRRPDRRREHRPQAAHGELAHGGLAAAQPQAGLRDAHGHARHACPPRPHPREVIPRHARRPFR